MLKFFATAVPLTIAIAISLAVLVYVDHNPQQQSPQYCSYIAPWCNR